jgi:cyclophilin family peptidyl-prolyl cis-trans isomerase
MLRRMRITLAFFSLVLTASGVFAQDPIEIVSNQRVRIETTLGDIVVELDHDRAPLSVENFVRYIAEGYYEGTIFHRVEPTFIIQGGGFLPDLTRKTAERTVANESGNGLSNQRGTIGMARLADPHSAGSEFYFNLVDNIVLDPRPSRWGYAVFGEIVEGMEVVDRMGSVPTGASGEFDRNVPVEPILIERIELLDE